MAAFCSSCNIEVTDDDLTCEICGCALCSTCHGESNGICSDCLASTEDVEDDELGIAFDIEESDE